MNLEESYSECLVKRQNTFGGIFVNFFLKGFAGLMALLVIFFLAVVPAPSIALLLFIIFSVAFFLSVYLTPRFKVTWEYVFCDGQLDFDQILGGNGGSSRRSKLRIDFDQLEIVCKTDSDKLKEFANLKAVNYDCSSLVKGAETYTVICRITSGMVRVKFEPDEKMLDLMKKKSPRKVFI